MKQSSHHDVAHLVMLARAQRQGALGATFRHLQPQGRPGQELGADDPTLVAFQFLVRGLDVPGPRDVVHLRLNLPTYLGSRRQQRISNGSGGGGFSGAGANASNSSGAIAGIGGDGVANGISGIATWYAGGGAGGQGYNSDTVNYSPRAMGGLGGGGR